MQTTRGLDRLVFFTDAVTAIAITLLILPLVDSVTTYAASGQHTALQFLQHNVDQLGACALSFVVIARLWVSHHASFEHVRSYNSGLLWLSLLWAFTIVVLPLPTSMIAEFPTSTTSVAFYIGTMAFSSLTLTVMLTVVRRHPDLESTENPVSARTYVASVLTMALFIVALIVGVLAPRVNFFAMLALLLTGPLEWAYFRWVRPAPADDDSA